MFRGRGFFFLPWEGRRWSCGAGEHDVARRLPRLGSSPRGWTHPFWQPRPGWGSASKWPTGPENCAFVLVLCGRALVHVGDYWFPSGRREDADTDALLTPWSINGGGSGLSIKLFDYGVGFYNNLEFFAHVLSNWL